MNPARAVAGSIISKAVIFQLLARPIVPLPSAHLRGLAPLDLPTTRQTTDGRVHQKRSRIGDRQPTLQEAERRTRRQFRPAEPITPAQARFLANAAEADRDPALAEKRPTAQNSDEPEIVRSTGTAASFKDIANAAVKRRSLINV